MYYFNDFRAVFHENHITVLQIPLNGHPWCCDKSLSWIRTGQDHGLWTVRAETRHQVRLISSTLILDDERNLFLLIIQIRARSSLSVLTFNRRSCGFWIALPVSQTRRRTLETPSCHTPWFLEIALWDSPQPDNQTMSSIIPDGILAGMIALLFRNWNFTATAHSWIYSIQMRYCFWSN